MSFFMDQGLRRLLDVFPNAMSQGPVVWASLVVATTDLFQRGDRDDHGVIVYPSALHMHDNLDGVVAAASSLRDLWETERTLDASEEVWRKRLQGSTWFAPEPVPGIEPIGAFLAASVRVVRKHLPNGILSGSCFPVVVNPGCHSPVILPERFWPRTMKDSWASSSQQA
jgi:hypothetical protein